MESDIYPPLNKNSHHKTLFQADKVLTITIGTWFTVKFGILEKNGASHSQVLFKVSALKNFEKFTVKHLCHRLIVTQKMKFSIKDFFCKCDQIHSFLFIWSHLLKKSLMENFIFCAVDQSMMNYFCGMTERLKTLSLIFSWDHCQMISPSQTSQPPRAGLETRQNQSWLRLCSSDYSNFIKTRLQHSVFFKVFQQNFKNISSITCFYWINKTEGLKQNNSKIIHIKNSSVHRKNSTVPCPFSTHLP